MLRFIKNGFLFLLLCIFQIYFEGGSFFIRPIIDFLLIFLIFSFFHFPFFYFEHSEKKGSRAIARGSYLTLLLLTRGIIFDTVSGLAWGTNLFSLFFSFGIGFFLTRLLESDNFLSRIIIGESIINIYFLTIYISNLLISHSNLWLIVLIDAFINSAIYLTLMILVQKIKSHGFKKKFNEKT